MMRSKLRKPISMGFTEKKMNKKRKKRKENVKLNRHRTNVKLNSNKDNKLTYTLAHTLRAQNEKRFQKQMIYSHRGNGK